MNWLKEIRRKKEKTQDDIAKAIPLSRSAYANIENGLRYPSVKVAKRIGRELEFDWTKFFS